jgi:GR25 family glycosyltransferase involved in LPS biosynthesis
LKQIESNDEIALVFEDDCVFKDDFIHHLYCILKKLPHDWEVICLGGPTTHNEYPAVALPNSIKMLFHSDEIVLFEPSTPAPCTVSSILYNKNVASKILKSIFINPYFFCPSDHTLWLCNMEQNVKMLWSQPFITYEGSKSDLFLTSLERGF